MVGGIVYTNFMGWIHGQRLGVRRMLKDMLDKTDSRTIIMLKNDGLQIPNKDDRISFIDIYAVQEMS